MDRGFIKLYRDMVDSSDGALSFDHKSTLLYFYIALKADYNGKNKGKLITDINHLAYKIDESYHTTRRWLDSLCNSKLLSVVKTRKDTWVITVENYCRLSGNSVDNVNELLSGGKNAVKTCPDNEDISDSYEPLKKEEERIKNKEKKKIYKRKKEKFETRQDAVAAIAADLPKYVEYANSKSSRSVDASWVRREIEKWSNWMDANNRSFSDYNKAFMNWLINATAYLEERQPVQRNKLEDIPLLSANDYC